MKKPVIFLLVAGLLIALSGCASTGPKSDPTAAVSPAVPESPVIPKEESIADKCAAGGGTWLADHEECENVARDWCLSAGGGFEECASACRNAAAEAVECTLQCIPVCSFSIKSEILADRPDNAQYLIEGTPVKLDGGISESRTNASSTGKSVTKILGAPVYGDLNGDGKADAALYLVKDDGGSGTFYYAAAAEKRDGGYLGLDAVYLGDRIAPGKIEVKGRAAAFNFQMRTTDEPMTAAPTVDSVRTFTILDVGLREVPESGVIDACLKSGGQLATSTCCATGLDMPDQCLIGSCGCAPQDSRTTWVCDCGEGKCFDGNVCK